MKKINAHALLNNWRKAVAGKSDLKQIRNIYIRSNLHASGSRGTGEEWVTSRGEYTQNLSVGLHFKSLTVFDGKKGWTRDYNGNVRNMAGAEIANLVTSAYVQNLSHLKGNLQGKTRFAGKETGCYILKLFPKNGLPITFYLDKSTFLPKRAIKCTSAGIMTLTFGEWKKVNGIKFPFKIEETGNPVFGSIAQRVKKISFNQETANELFEQPADQAKDVRFVSQKGSIEIPFKPILSQIFLQGKVNDSNPLWFILDTGAGCSVINSAFVKPLGLKQGGKVEGHGGGEKAVALSLVRLPSFSLPGVKLVNQIIVATPLASLEPFLGHKIDGILGYDFISRFVVKIDYSRKKIYLYKPGKHQYAGHGRILPITLEDNTPRLKAGLLQNNRKKLNGTFMVDSGCGTSLIFCSPFVKQNHLLQQIRKTVQIPNAGIGGLTKNLRGKVDEFQINKFLFRKIAATFYVSEKGSLASPFMSGLIGSKILERFNVVFDYPGQQMILEPNLFYRKPFKQDASGLRVIAKGPDFRTFVVLHVLDGSPASEAGFQEGDIILSINGNSSRSYALHEVCELFEEERQCYLIEARRKGEVFKTSLKTRPLI